VNLSANPNIRGLTEQARAYDNTLRKTASPAGVSPNVRGLTGQARTYDNTLQRTATPDGYVPPPAKRPRRKKSGGPDSSAARGPLARLNPRSWSERGEALDKNIDDEGCWPRAAATGTRLSPVSSPRPLHREEEGQCSAASLPASLMPAARSCLEGGSVGVHGWTRDRLLPATRSQGPTTERALTPPARLRVGVASGVSQQTSTTLPVWVAAEGSGGAAEQNAPSPAPPMTSVSVVERAAYRENFVLKEIVLKTTKRR